LEPDLLVKIDGNHFPADYVAGRRADIDAVINCWRRTKQADWPRVERNLNGWRVYWAWPEEGISPGKSKCNQVNG
jgi:hypothetical protein